MSTDHHTPWQDGVTQYKASDMNVPLGELDEVLDGVSGEIQNYLVHNHALASLSEKAYSSLTSPPADDDFNSLTAVTSPVSTDTLPIYSGGAYHKVTKSNLLAGVSGSGELLTTAGVGISYQSIDMPGEAAVINVLMPYSMEFPVDFNSGELVSYYYAATGPTSEQTVTFKRNGTEFGTLVVEASETSGGTWHTSGETFDRGDRLSIAFPGTQDTTWAGVAITLTGSR
jgi:hypothetical protein